MWLSCIFFYYVCFFFSFFFFFFQAEDGIRDRDVTGVQTCALPISRVLLAVTSVPSSSTRVPLGSATNVTCATRSATAAASSGSIPRRRAASPRSEERRVGKECRSGWSPDRSKKKQETHQTTNTAGV